MKSIPKLVASAAVAVVLVIAGVAPANAAVSKSGTRYCSSSAPSPWLRSQATGAVTHHSPGGGVRVFYNGVTLTVNNSPGVAPGGSWSVSSDGSLVDAGTYAWCSPAV